jgi:hypothetical protein
MLISVVHRDRNTQPRDTVAIHAGSLSGSLKEACLVFTWPTPKHHWGVRSDKRCVRGAVRYGAALPTSCYAPSRPPPCGGSGELKERNWNCVLGLAISQMPTWLTYITRPSRLACVSKDGGGSDPARRPDCLILKNIRALNCRKYVGIRAAS